MTNMSTFFQYPTEEQVSQEPKFLENFSDKDLQKLYSIGETQQFTAGEVALTAGGTDTSLYIVLEGEAQVLIPKRKGWFKVATLVPGTVFGELSFFDHMPRSAQVAAVSDCSVLKISEYSFQHLLVHDTSLALAFVLDLSKILSIRLRHMNQMIQTLMK